MAYTKFKNPWTPADLVPPAAALNWIEAGVQAMAAVADTAQISLQAVANKVLSGTGSPEGVTVASVGTVYLRLDGTAGATLYIKETGSGNTGWRVR